MKLLELMEKQTQLNKAIGSYPASPEPLAMALVEECGELSRELRGDWRWWSWDGKEYEIDRAKVVEELNDIFKFSLVGLICFSEPDDIETASKYWNCDWEKLGCDPVSVELSEICQSFMDESGWQAIASIARICALLKISKEELEAAYLAKWKINMQRTKGAIA